MGNYILTTNGELYHYGVKGMKWGVRRYQNADGTFTSVGKKRQKQIDRFEKKRSKYSDKLTKEAAGNYKASKILSDVTGKTRDEEYLSRFKTTGDRLTKTNEKLKNLDPSTSTIKDLREVYRKGRAFADKAIDEDISWEHIVENKREIKRGRLTVQDIIDDNEWQIYYFQRQQWTNM